MKHELVLSALGHTWILDLDGTIVRHNGYKLDGKDSFLPGAQDFLSNIPTGDMIVFLTSRTTEFQKQTEQFLRENGIRYDHILYNAPYGERILVNDKKPSGLTTACAVNLERDAALELTISCDNEL